jgi:hypothetical protein
LDLPDKSVEALDWNLEAAMKGETNKPIGLHHHYLVSLIELMYAFVL